MFIKRILVLFLAFSPALGGLNFEFAGLNINPERFLAFFIFLPTIAFNFFLTNNSKHTNVYLNEFFYYIWLIILSISTAISGNFSILFFSLITCLTPIIYAKSIKILFNFNDFINSTYICFLFMCIGGITSYVFKISWAIDDLGRLKFFSLEPNIFGATVGVYFFASGLRGNAKIVFINFLLAVSSIILSFSRGPLIGFAIATLFYMYKIKIIKLEKIFIFIILFLIFLITGALDEIINRYNDGFGRSETLNARELTITFAIDQWKDSIFIGNGAYSFGLSRYAQQMLEILGAENYGTIWIWNIFIAIMHDSGIIGLTAFLLFLILTFQWLNAEICKKNTYAIHVFTALSFLVVSSQATTIHTTSVFGIILGIVFSCREEVNV